MAPIIADYWERAEFPHHLLPAISNLGIAGLISKPTPTSKGMSLMSAGLITAEIARVDCSLSTFLLVHASLAMLTIDMLGSIEQKLELLPKMSSLELIGCFGLTEPDYGSDASSLTTIATKTEGGWVLNGQKRWIGNGTFADIFIIWARNSETKQVNAFIVRKGSRGLKTTKIQNKTALRCVQNADIELKDVYVPDKDHLPQATSFKDTSKVLAVSRLMVVWQTVGVTWGVYDMCVRYSGQRRQFGSPISSFQLIQERLSRMQGNIQAMTLLIWRATTMQENGSMTHGLASSIKAHVTLKARETVALGREVLGGNGVSGDFHVGKAFCDLEALYTYEGTYDINSLVSGREISGISAIKRKK